MQKAAVHSFRLAATALGSNRDGKSWVWRVRSSADGEVVEPVDVIVLVFRDATVTVNGQLSAEDRIVTAGVHLLKPDMPVKPIARTDKASL
jgi:multidrug efflux system membrane fusion protein